MDTKITLQDIIEILIKKHSMERKDAEAFVKGMFELIENALAVEKFVKIKGLGTFKLIDVDSRESINVNTGERFEIQGHSKISFIPDSSLKNTINKPFAHFETVVLNDETNLENTDVVEENPANITSDESSDDMQSNIEVEDYATVTEQNTIEPSTDERTIGTEDSTVPAIEEKETIDATEVESEENSYSEEKINADENNENVNITSEEPEVEDNPLPADVSDNSEESNETQENETKENVAEKIEIEETEIENNEENTYKEEEVGNEEEVQPSEEVKTEESIHPEIINRTRESYTHINEHKDKHIRTWLIVAVIVIVALIGVIFYLMNQSSSNTSTPATPQTDKVTLIPEEKNDTTSDNDTIVKDSIHSAVEVTKQDVKSEDNNKSATKSLSTYDDTIKYRTAGTKTTHVLQKGESIVKLSLKYYGSKKLWTYIVEYNKEEVGSNGDKVVIGTKLKIPELKPIQ